CHQSIFHTNGSISRCGSGSHTPPNCPSPGFRESRIRRAMPRCATASPYSSTYPRVKHTASATKLSTTAAISTGVLSSRVAGRTTSGSGGGPAAAASYRPRLRVCDPRGAITVRPGLDGREVKMRNLPEQFKPRVNLLARHRLQALGAEALARKRSHYAAIEHRPAKHRRRQLRLRCEIPVEPSCKRIARARRVYHLGQRQRRRPERPRGRCASWERTLSKKRRRAELPVLY